MEFDVVSKYAAFGTTVLYDGGRISACVDKTISEASTTCEAGKEAGAESITGAGGVSNLDIFIDTEAVGFLAIGSNAAHWAVGNNDGLHVVLQAI